MSYLPRENKLEYLCEQNGVGLFDPSTDTYAYLTGSFYPDHNLYKIHKDFGEQRMQPLWRGLSAEEIKIAFNTVIKRPTPMMRYPKTFLQDPIYWSIMDFDFYLHVHRSLSEINRARAIHFYRQKQLPIDVSTLMYVRYLEPFNVPFYGIELNCSRQGTCFDTVYSRRDYDLGRMWDALSNKPAWYSLALYRYYKAKSDGGKEGVDAMIKNSALTSSFWRSVIEDYDEFISGFIEEKSMEILGIASLFGITQLVDMEYEAELNACTDWLGDDYRPLFNYIPNLYGVYESTSNTFIADAEDAAKVNNDRRWRNLAKAYIGNDKYAGLRQDMIKTSLYVEIWANELRLRYPAQTDLNLNYVAIFGDKLHTTQDPRSYRLPELNNILLNRAAKSAAILDLYGEEIPFISNEQRKMIREIQLTEPEMAS